MNPVQPASEYKKGILFAVAATLLWSGNFIVARGVIHQVPPVTLAFFRWATATLLLLPFAWRQVVEHFGVLKQNFRYLGWTAISGITIFNTLVYVAGHYSPAINLALIGTTSSPVFSTLLAAIFLKEKITAARLAGMLVCFAGILLLLSQGSWQVLSQFRFGTGDLWVLAGAFSFALYTIQVRRKPANIPTLAFLWTVFAIGTLLLFPALVWESESHPPVKWTPGLVGVVLYLGLGTSVIAFMIWNLAIARLGAARTALFGNLIPLFSTIEAVLILGEPVQTIHLLSGALILAGLFIANRQQKARVAFT
jgi:drug/metabolite transporter (DMT)-like permease